MFDSTNSNLIQPILCTLSGLLRRLRASNPPGHNGVGLYAGMRLRIDVIGRPRQRISGARARIGPYVGIFGYSRGEFHFLNAMDHLLPKIFTTLIGKRYWCQFNAVILFNLIIMKRTA